MKVFSVFGISGSGKTTTIENIIKELIRRGYSVGSVKEIHFEDFAIDQEGTNTYRHKVAGADVVTARGNYETDILYPRRLSLNDILRFYDHDFVVCEGKNDDANIPRIITANNEEEIIERLDDTVFAISGKIANQMKSFRNLPVINGIEEAQELVDLIEEKVYDKLPDFSPKCCTACGYTCRKLGIKILKGEAKREDCVVSDTNIKLLIDGKDVSIVPFVQDVLRNVVKGVVQELEGYRQNGSIEIRIGDKDVR